MVHAPGVGVAARAGRQWQRPRQNMRMPAPPTGHGLPAASERLAEADGILRTGGAPGQGTILEASVPLGSVRACTQLREQTG